jgi:hypothetical protein
MQMNADQRRWDADKNELISTRHVSLTPSRQLPRERSIICDLSVLIRVHLRPLNLAISSHPSSLTPAAR